MKRAHFSTRTHHYSTTLAHLRAERAAWQTDRLDHAGDDRAGHSTGLTSGHCQVTGQRGSSDTTLVISHWQHAGTGLLPELAHLSELLSARQQTRPESVHRLRQPEYPGDRAGHSGQLAGPVRAGAVA